MLNPDSICFTVENKDEHYSLKTNKTFKAFLSFFSDDENPFINCPLVDYVNVKNGTNGSTINLMVTANDIVDGRINTTCWIDDAFGSHRVSPDYIFPVGETTVTCNASDASDNTDTCSFGVTVLGKI